MGEGDRSFTLVELLVVMAIIAIIGGITVFSVREIFRDAKLSSGVNTVMAALDNARSLAMKNNKLTCVAFRAQRDEDDEVYVEAVTAEFTGEVYTVSGSLATDRYAPVKGAPVRRLPSGIKVAAPAFLGNSDEYWMTQSELSQMSETAGEVGGLIVAVIYNPRGEIITTNAESDALRAFVDFDDDFHIGGNPPGGQDREGRDPYTYVGGDGPGALPQGFAVTELYTTAASFYTQRTATDESFFVTAPFIAVYDDEAARSQFDPRVDWAPYDSNAAVQNYLEQLSSYITANAKRIHFNRYTGVTMK